ncbi:unnamed protein product [Sympodiomycopsis kandeliae]
MSTSQLSSSLPKKKCLRCGQPATLLLRKTLPACTECAQKAVENRAKGLLEHARGAAILDRLGELDLVRDQGLEKGKQKDVSMRGGVALAFSGGASSRALLDIAARNLKPPSRSQAAELEAAMNSNSTSSSKSRKSRPVDVTRIDVIYIDDSAVIAGAQDATEQVRQIVEAQGGEEAGLNFVPLKLEDVFSAEEDDGIAESVSCIVGPADARRISTQISRSDDRRSLLKSLFAQVYPPSTSRTSTASARSRAEDLHALLIQRLLLRTARSLGDGSVLLGDNASRGAISLIDGVAKGRGHKWPVEGASVMWQDGLLVLRPLRDALAKEIAFFNKTLSLQDLTSKDVVSSEIISNTRRIAAAVTPTGSNSSASTTGALEKASIGRLTENFIYSLEKGVPSTVSTVGRTGSKLVLKQSSSEEDSNDVTPFQEFFSSNAATTSTDDSLENQLDSVSISTSSNRPKLSGLGQKGDRLIAAVRQLPQWSSIRNGCAFCLLPTQAGSSQWKSKLSITSKLKLDENGQPIGVVDEKEESKSDIHSESHPLALDQYLCYSCTFILDVPEEVASQNGVVPTLALPSFVLTAAQRRQAHNQR